MLALIEGLRLGDNEALGLSDAEILDEIEGDSDGDSEALGLSLGLSEGDKLNDPVDGDSEAEID